MHDRAYSYWRGLAWALLLIVLINGRTSFAWKPIASSGSPITSYSLKQSHPGEASSSHELATSYSQFGSDKDVDDLVLPHSAVNGVETGTITHPIILNEDQENHYDSYILKDDVFKESSLSFSRTPVYSSSSSLSSSSDRCSVKKFAFNQDGAVEYNNELPELNQFTLCFWMRFTNHSGDHVMLTYEGECGFSLIIIRTLNCKFFLFFNCDVQ